MTWLMNNPKPALQGEGAQAPSTFPRDALDVQWLAYSESVWADYCDTCARIRHDTEKEKCRNGEIIEGSRSVRTANPSD